MHVSFTRHPVKGETCRKPRSHQLHDIAAFTHTLQGSMPCLPLRPAPPPSKQRMALLQRHTRGMSEEMTQGNSLGRFAEHRLARTLIKPRQYIRVRPGGQDLGDGLIEPEEALLNTLQCSNGGQEFRHRRKPHDRVGSEGRCTVVHGGCAECSNDGVT